MTDYNALDRSLDDDGVGILPTETVYGLVARADRPEAVERIYAIKGRDFAKPLVLCVRDLPQAEIYGQFSALARHLARRFWPGPLTLVVPARLPAALPGRLYGQNAGGEVTIALRCPDVDWRAHIHGLPLTLTSANRSGEAAPADYASAARALEPYIDFALQGTAPLSGQPTTILAVGDDVVTCLREGTLTERDVARLDFADFRIVWTPDA